MYAWVCLQMPGWISILIFIASVVIILIGVFILGLLWHRHCRRQPLRSVPEL